MSIANQEERRKVLGEQTVSSAFWVDIKKLNGRGRIPASFVEDFIAVDSYREM